MNINERLQEIVFFKSEENLAFYSTEFIDQQDTSFLISTIEQQQQRIEELETALNKIRYYGSVSENAYYKIAKNVLEDESLEEQTRLCMKSAGVEPDVKGS